MRTSRIPSALAALLCGAALFTFACGRDREEPKTADLETPAVEQPAPEAEAVPPADIELREERSVDAREQVAAAEREDLEARQRELDRRETELADRARRLRDLERRERVAERREPAAERPAPRPAPEKTEEVAPAPAPESEPEIVKGKAWGDGEGKGAAPERTEPKNSDDDVGHA